MEGYVFKEMLILWGERWTCGVLFPEIPEPFPKLSRWDLKDSRSPRDIVPRMIHDANDVFPLQV